MTPLIPARITAAEVMQRLKVGEPIFFIDTRSEEAWNASDIKIPGAHRIHYSEIEKHLWEIPRDRLIVTFCT